MEFSLDESYDEDYSAVEDMICNEMEKGSPEYIKRKDISNAARASRKAGVDFRDAITGKTSPHQRINIRKELSKNGYFNGGKDKIKAAYNDRHARIGDNKRWLD